MGKVMVQNLAAEVKQEVMMTLIYKGKIAAIKLYKERMGCRLYDAKIAIERLGVEIEPGAA